MSDVERTYLAKKGQGGISALYMIEQGPDWSNDRVLHSSGWAPTSAIWDWRVGERSDLDEITEQGQEFAVPGGEAGKVLRRRVWSIEKHEQFPQELQPADQTTELWNPDSATAQLRFRTP